MYHILISHYVTDARQIITTNQPQNNDQFKVSLADLSISYLETALNLVFSDFLTPA